MARVRSGAAGWRWLRRRLAPPSGLRARIRWLFLLASVWLIVSTEPQILLGSHSDLRPRLGAVVALLALGALQVAGYRAGGFRLPVLEVVLEAALVASASVLNGNIRQMLGAFIVPLFFRTLYGSVWQSGWSVLSYAAGYLAVVIAWPAIQGNPRLMGDAELVANLMGIITSGSLMYVIAYVTRSQERAERRAQTLAQAGAALVAANGRAAVCEAALEAVHALLAEARVINVTLSVQEGENTEVVAAHGADAAVLLGRHLHTSRVPAEYVLRPDRPRVLLDAAATARLQSALGMPVRPAALTFFLLCARENPVGILGVETAAPLPAEAVAALGMLSSEVALAFESVRLTANLQDQAFHDPLTRLANRAQFVDCLERALARGRRHATTLAMLFVDLDNFKVINDSLGHAAGDQLLCTVAERLRACVRPSDVVARLGGDEFAVLVEDIADAAEARGVADRIAAEVWQPLELNGCAVTVTGSIGIALSSSGSGSFGELLRAADLALYAAKDAGKAQAAVFDPTMVAASRQRLELEADLRQALERQEFEVHYQPLVRLRDGRIGEVEALLRWNHPRRGLIGPAEFIPLAEETSLIVPLGRWVLQAACRQVKTWQDALEGPARLILAVNLSGRQLRQPALVDDVRTILAETGLPPATLKLEITESVAVADTLGNRRTLRALRELGVRLAIDDFGTGASAIDYLRRFPVDALKIDRSFIDGLGRDERTTALVRAIIAFGSSLGLSVTGEGIETPEQSAQLRAMGCDWGQGYLFARPVAAERITELLAHADQQLPAA